MSYYLSTVTVFSYFIQDPAPHRFSLSSNTQYTSTYLLIHLVHLDAERLERAAALVRQLPVREDDDQTTVLSKNERS